MAKLRCESFAERVFVPGLHLLLPDALSVRLGERSATARPRRRPAAACWCAREALRAAGGIAAIRDALIDDCALAQRLKAHGPIWLGLTDACAASAPIRRSSDIRRMVARSAYAQLRLFAAAARRHRRRHGAHLSGAVLLALFATGCAQVLGLAAWALMALAFQPILRLLSAVAAVGPGAAGDRRDLHGCSRSIPPISMRAAAAACGRARVQAEALTGTCDDERAADDTALGQGPPRRELSRSRRGSSIRAIAAPILAFYEFVRAADDIADHATLAPDEKLALLDRLGGRPARRERRRCRRRCGCARRWPSAACRRATRRTCLTAFRLDVTKLRYATGTT